MNPWKIANLALAAALLALLGLNAGVRGDRAERNLEFFPEMVHSVPFDPYSRHPGLPDRMTLQQPPEGSIPRGYTPFPYGPGAEEAIRAGEELTLPAGWVVAGGDGTGATVGADPGAETSTAAFAVDADRGAAVYRSFCLPCHGPKGMGDGLVAMRGYPPPPSLHAANALSLPPGRLYHIIVLGQANMPGYAHQIKESDRWQVVSHVLELQGRGSAQPASIGVQP